MLKKKNQYFYIGVFFYPSICSFAVQNVNFSATSGWYIYIYIYETLKRDKTVSLEACLLMVEFINFLDSILPLGLSQPSIPLCSFTYRCRAH